jgi:DNA-binding beta-propeller fold protein YncE
VVRALGALAFAAALAAACSLNLSGFQYFSCTQDADCQPGQVCEPGLGTCGPPGSTTGGGGASGTSGGAGGGSTGLDGGLAPGISIQQVAGGGSAGHLDGPAASALFKDPYGLALSGSQLYVTEVGNYDLRAVDLGAGTVRTVVDGGYDPDGLGSAYSIAIDGNEAYVGSGDYLNEVALPGGAWSELYQASAPFTELVPYGVAYLQGTLYVSDWYDACVGAFDVGSGSFSVFAGKCQDPGTANGSLTAAQFEEPTGIAAGPSGELYVADQKQNVIRLVAGGNVSVFAGTGKAPDPPLDGPVAQATFYGPFGLAVDSRGDVFVSEELGGIREIERFPDGGAAVRTLAAYAVGGANPLVYPTGLALDEAGGKLYVADIDSNEIWVMTGFY